MILHGKQVVLGVTGGIAAFKAAALCSTLVKSGASVDVVMTEAACEFVAPMTFQALTHRPVITGIFSLLSETDIGHVALADRAELVIIAPATANTIAKMAAGMADNMLTATVLATEAPILIAPAMESHMWSNALTQANLARLRALRPVHTVGPGTGRLASGASGPGRMAEPDEVLDSVRWLLGRGGRLAGRRVLVTAGGTREPLDPIRYLGNRSSGRMGLALATAARDLGANVTLVSTSHQHGPRGVNVMPVDTAAEMRDRVMAALPETDFLVMAAAVADYRPANVAEHKIKKRDGGLTLELERTPDILLEVAGRRRPDQCIVGFAAETERLVDHAREKLRRKRLDLIVANDASQAMGADTNRATLIADDESVIELPLMTKEALAGRLFDWILGWQQRWDTQEEERIAS